MSNWFRTLLRNAPTLLLAIATLLSACAPSITRSSGDVTDPSSTPTERPKSTASPSPIDTELEQTSTSSPEDITCTHMKGEWLNQLVEVESQVSQIRGWYASDVVRKEWFSKEELSVLVVEQFLDRYSEEDAMRDETLLAMLGLVPDDIHLRDLYAALLREQVAGFYDSKNTEMRLLCDPEFSGLERVTYVHEFVHALQDERYDFDEVLKIEEADCKADPERCLAIQSLLEGDAGLLQEQWMRTYASGEDLAGILEFFSSFDMPTFASTPEFIQDDFTFPYLAGLHFVRHFFLKEDWAAIDEIYLDPPVSTEQIIHPERYPEDIPVALKIPELEDVTASGWKIVDEGQLGEWLVLSMLNQYIFPENADRAAEGWGGDAYQILVNAESGETAFVLLLEWDTMRDSHEFTSEFRDYGNQRFGDAKKYTVSSAVWDFEGGVSQMERVSNQTLWVIAPDAEALDLIWNSIRLPLRSAP